MHGVMIGAVVEHGNTLADWAAPINTLLLIVLAVVTRTLRKNNKNRAAMFQEMLEETLKSLNATKESTDHIESKIDTAVGRRGKGKRETDELTESASEGD